MADEKLIGRIDQTREQIQEKLIQLNRDIRAEFDALANELPEPAPPPAAPAPAASADLTSLIGAVHTLNLATSQVDLLRALVTAAGDFLPRVLLLIKKSGNLHGWASSGFSDEFSRNRMKKVRWQVDHYAELKHVVEHRAILAANFNDLSDLSNQIEQFDGFVPFRSVFFPLVVKNKVAAVIYADSGTEPQMPQKDAVALLCHVAGLELTLVAAKAKTAPVNEPAPEPEPEPTPAPPPAPRPVAHAPEPPQEVDASFVQRMETPSGGFQAYQDEPEPEPETEDEQVYAVDDFADDDDFDPPPSADDFDMPEPDFGPEEVPFAEEPQFAPPPEPSPAPEVEDDPAVKKAKRAARVLVSDLMLYNEAAVKAARQNGDLYNRLKEDIDRSYQHYKERISDLNPPSDRNFFKDEIVRQLAEGDPNLLGPLPF